MAPKPKIVDYHCHSTASDGQKTPAELIESASNFDFFAITDHDTTKGLASAAEKASEIGFKGFCPGIELTTNFRGMLVHLLGLNVNYHNHNLEEAVSTVQAERTESIRFLLEMAHSAGIWENVNFDEMEEWIKETYSHSAYVSKAHLALYLCIKNHFTDAVLAMDAIKKISFSGRPRCKDSMHIDLAAPLLKKYAKHIVVPHINELRANPWQERRILEELIGAYGVDAIEAISSKYNNEQIINYLILAKYLHKKYGTKLTVGSDYHSQEITPGINFGIRIGSLLAKSVLKKARMSMDEFYSMLLIPVSPR